MKKNKIMGDANNICMQSTGYLLILSRENLGLAEKEALNLLGFPFFFRQNEFLFLGKDADLSCIKRLAYTNLAYKILFIADWESFFQEASVFEWEKHYEGDFYVRTRNISKDNSKDNSNDNSNENNSLDALQISKIIWKSLKNPSVNVKNPKTTFDFLSYKELSYQDNSQGIKNRVKGIKNRSLEFIIAAKLLFENKKEYNKRKAHMRPALHPSSLSPKLARACINLTGAKKGEILDPFCGSGGFLIEAGLMGLNPVGYDIDNEMICRAKKNLEYYNIKGSRLFCRDAIKAKKKYDYIVTDLPYAKNTKNTDIKKLYSEFIQWLRKILLQRAVVIFPGSFDYELLINSSGLKKEGKFSIYIHKTMTKKVLLLKQKNP